MKRKIREGKKDNRREIMNETVSQSHSLSKYLSGQWWWSKKGYRLKDASSKPLKQLIIPIPLRSLYHAHTHRTTHTHTQSSIPQRKAKYVYLCLIIDPLKKVHACVNAVWKHDTNTSTLTDTPNCLFKSYRYVPACDSRCSRCDTPFCLWMAFH